MDFSKNDHSIQFEDDRHLLLDVTSFCFGQGCGNCKSFQSCHQCKPQLQSILKEQ